MKKTVFFVKKMAVCSLAGLLFIAPAVAQDTTNAATKPVEKPAKIAKKPESTQIEKGLAFLGEKKFNDSAKSFARGFEAKEPDAGFYLGRMFEMGLGTKKDLGRAKSLYIGSAELGSKLAANRLGMMHLAGTGVLQDFKSALTYFKAAGSDDKNGVGNANAQFNLGSLYWQGIGAPEDKAEALVWYGKAAEQGNIAAHNALGLAYLEGKGSVVKPELSYKHFVASGNKGNPVGLYQLGLMYELGFGVDQSNELAYVHFNLAAARSHPKAQESRQRVADVMTSLQLVDAQERTRSWVDKSEEERLNQFYTKQTNL